MDQSGRDPNAQPPAEDWQSQPQQPAPPPPAGGTGAGSGTPPWVGNLTSTAPVAGPAGFFYADVPNRTIAYIIDVIIVGIVGFIVAAVVGGVMGGIVNYNILSPGFGGINYGALIAVTVVGLAINAAYFMYTWVAMRGTVGMKLLGMQIGHESDGRTLTYQEAGLRWLLLGAPFGLAQLLNAWPGLGMVISLLGLVWLIALLVTTAQSPTKQGLHDRYAHSMVVKAGRSVA
jgi:uncharacterized RDD family membrane protein YckC